VGSVYSQNTDLLLSLSITKFSVKPPPPVDHFVEIREVDRMDPALLPDEFNRLDWSVLYAITDVDQQIIMLSDHVKRLYRNLCPYLTKMCP
jgi:hypothetical protein